MRSTRRMRAAMTAGLIALVAAAPSAARATWAESADLIYNTAHVLDAGEIEVGILSPFQYGVSEQVQVSIHPVLLLLLVPHVGMRWRVSPEGPLTVAVNVEFALSVLDQVNADGSRVITDGAGNSNCNKCGVPWSVQSVGTVSWEFAEGWLLSGGMGPAVDVVGDSSARGMVELHASLMWLIDPDNLLMLHGSIAVHPWYSDTTSYESAQLMYARAFGVMHLGVGIAVGQFDIITETDLENFTDEITTIPVWPVVDLWWRF